MSDRPTEPPSRTPERVPRARGCRAAVIVAVATLGLAAALDAPLAAALSSPALGPRLAKIIDVLAGISVYVVVLALLAAAANRRRLWAGFLLAVFLSAGVLHGTKWMIGRARPLAGLGPWHFTPFQGAKYGDSFPSGHSSAVATLAILLSLYFPRGRWVFCGVMLLTGLERVVSRWHYPSDVLGGYAQAALVIWACYRVLGPEFFRPQPPLLAPLER